MDPYSGKLYPSLSAALADGVQSPVEVAGTPDALDRLSRAAAHYSEVVGPDRDKRRAANKAARKARRRNRR